MKPNWGSLFICAASLLTVDLRAAEAPLAIDKATSRVEIAVKATADSFVGKLADYVATVVIDRDTGAVTTSRVTFHFSDVKTGNEKRDREMNEWQQTEKFPGGEFALDSLTPVSPGKFTVHGQLSFHGSTHELSFPAAIARDGAAVTIDGEAVIDTRTFGLPVIRKFAVLKVDPLVTVRFHLAGSLASP